MIDWGSIFGLKMPIGEVLVRGTVAYLALVLVLRFGARRQFSTLAVTDLLVIILIGDAVQNAIISTSTSITDGIMLVIVIVFWSYTLDWLGFRYPKIERLLHPPALPIIKHGKIIQRNMRHELLTIDDLHAAMREEGVDKLSNIKVAFMESDGKISFVCYESHEKPITSDKNTAV